ncbi:MAG: PspC domain-containing protein [Chloroflexi bacterium]|nr:PspC domain-containing protein [Chloroflexota bacterium]
MASQKLYRARRGAWVAGVAKGIANWSGIPVTLIRLLWILALLPGGVPGILPYIILWVLVPKEPRHATTA